MTRRRVYLTDFSIPLGVAGILVVGWVWGWRVALVVVVAGVLLTAAAIAAVSLRGERLRGTTVEVGDRPLLIHLYSPY
ncbi:MAG TPA: hypothetical protein VGR24_07525 [bacterium]|jgi:hypothetical protein|nr:hypothetical protein [bacterium]